MNSKFELIRIFNFRNNSNFRKQWKLNDPLDSFERSKLKIHCSFKTAGLKRSGVEFIVHLKSSGDSQQTSS